MPFPAARCNVPVVQQAKAGTEACWPLASQTRGDGREPGPVQEVEHYQLDTVGLTSAHAGSGNQTSGEHLEGCGDTHKLLALHCCVVLSLRNMRVVSMQLQVAGRKALIVVCAYAPNSSIRLCSDHQPKSVIWHIQTVSRLILESLDSEKNTWNAIFANRDPSHICWWFEMQFKADFYRCDSIRTFWLLKSDFKVCFVSLATRHTTT